MMKWLDSPKHLFLLLALTAVIAILGGVWLSLSCGVVQVLDALAQGPAEASVVVETASAGLMQVTDASRRVTLASAVYVITALINCALWVTAWISFLRMCLRLRKGGTAFTRVNSRTLKVIGACVSLIGAVMCLRALPRLLRGPDVYLAIEAVILPGTFVTIGVLAFILSRLLDHAMALEAEQADVI